MRHRRFIRDFLADGYLDLFLVTAVAAVLVIRLVLRLTGFPQLGNDTLHIAHMLWGGLLMLIAMIVLLSFVGPQSRQLAAVVGGAGFGTFIDEVGKFLTQDNDYFFEPAVAIIYIVFVLTYILIRWIQSGRPRTSVEYLINALNEIQQIAIGDLDRHERDRALAYLDNSDQSVPMVGALRHMLNESVVVAPTQPNWLARSKNAALRMYQALTMKRWFARSIVLFFAGQLAIQIAHVTMVLVFHKSWLEFLTRRPLETFGSEGTRITAFGLSVICFSALAAGFVGLGVVQIKKSRLSAYRNFQRSILVSLLLIQPLMFYRDQWTALIGLTFDILVFLALRFMIDRERWTKSGSTNLQEVQS
ncbi:MAG: hypothetical protein PVF33_02840 [Candidatus Latescibacterota bacterium]|jgi:hypothetical protein